MKFKFIYTTFFFLFTAFIFLASSGGRADSQGWGNTGAPGDQTLTGGAPRTCVSCHNSGSGSVDLTLEMKDADGLSVVDQGYVPGETYEMTISVDVLSGSFQEYGFQMLALNAPEGDNGAEVSDWSMLSANTQMAIASNTNRTYVEQNGPSTTNEFTMSWTAPDDLDGEVTFYTCGNAVNGNNMSNGDNAACLTLSIDKSISSSVVSFNQSAISLTVFPNPVRESANILIDVKEAGAYRLQLMNTAGQILYKEQQFFPTGNTSKNINLKNFSSGLYMLQLIQNQQVYTKKLVKL